MFELQQNGKGLGWGGGEVGVETHAGNPCAEEVQTIGGPHKGHWPAPTKKNHQQKPPNIHAAKQHRSHWPGQVRARECLVDVCLLLGQS